MKCELCLKAFTHLLRRTDELINWLRKAERGNLDDVTISYIKDTILSIRIHGINELKKCVKEEVIKPFEDTYLKAEQEVRKVLEVPKEKRSLDTIAFIRRSIYPYYSETGEINKLIPEIAEACREG
jgi:hypothetical protein